MLNMYYRLLIPSLKKHYISCIRQFKINPWLLKNAEQKIQQTESDEPIKYSTSEAGKWKAIYSSSGKAYYETPRIQDTVVVFSLTALMVYFCILREENDLDDWLRELETNVPIQVEELQLRAEIETGKRQGIDVSFKESRLKEIVAMRENRNK